MTKNQSATAPGIAGQTSKNLIKIVLIIVGLALGAAIGTMHPPAGLTAVAMKFLGIFFSFIYMLIFQLIPMTTVVLLACAACVIFDVAKVNVAFNQFASDTYFMILGAMGIGAAVSSSGLLKRVSWIIMTWFPGTYKGQVLAFLTAGTIISPFIPSNVAKLMIAAPFGRAVAENLGLNKESQGAAGIFSAIYLAFYNLAPLFLSATVYNYLLKGLLPKDIAASFTWGQWFLSAAPWGIVTLVLHYFAYTMLFKDDSTVKLPKGFAKEQVEKMGGLSRPEIITTVVVLISVLLWVTERSTGLSPTMVAVVAFGVLYAFSVIGPKEIKDNIPWETLIHIAAILSIASVFGIQKIDKWISTIMGPYIQPFTTNPYVFVASMAIFTYLVRFVIISAMTTFTVFSIILMPFAVNAGYNPFIVPFTILVSMAVYNVVYQNVIFLAGLAGSGQMCEFKNTVKGSIAYMVINLLGLLASIPVWKLLGLV
jgi:DASS family divalent anion:Na+ symporter